MVQPPTASELDNELLPFLLNPHSYPHRPRHVRLVQTHASFVFIASPFVYKIKKPVNFGFLNFSTLERRKYFCEREVVLNRRLCPKVYLGVVPLVRGPKGLHFGGEGEAVEYAVKMRKLSDHGFMDKLLARNEVSSNDLVRIAKALTHFYRAHPPDAAIGNWGTIKRLKISTKENFDQAEDFSGKTISPVTLAAIRRYTQRFYSVHKSWFARRIRENRIRDCHGDLHLEHIHITPKALQIYDCIEFNDRFRYVDVANDVAFLAMDLDFEGRSDLSRHFVHCIAGTLRDPSMLVGMDFYKCYRAFVRGKVESLRSIAPGTPESEQIAAAERAHRYFRLALSYAVAGTQPLALVIVGRIASGKSTVARALAKELDWPLFSSDRIRKESAGIPLFERTSEQARRRLYSPSMTAQTYRTLGKFALQKLRLDRNVILDATFARRVQRAEMRRRLAGAGFQCCFVELKASDRAVKERLLLRELKKDEISDARLEDFAPLTSIYEAPEALEKVITVRTTSNPALALRDVLVRLVDRHVFHQSMAPAEKAESRSASKHQITADSAKWSARRIQTFSRSRCQLEDKAD